MPNIFSNPILCLQKTRQLQEHFYSHETFINDVSPETIYNIIQTSAWQTLDQKITSAETNDDSNAEPDMASIQAGDNTCGVDAFADLKFDKSINRILDVGGGKFDCCYNYMKLRGINLLTWDPYNRPTEHNINIQRLVTTEKVSVATSMAVLNVIHDINVRLAHISTLKTSLTVNGTAYFKVWPGNNPLKGSYQPTVNSYKCPGYQANSYADRFLREIQLVFGLNNTKLHETIPNTIVAKKISNDPTSILEIQLIQKLSISEPWHFKRKDWITNNHALFSKIMAVTSVEDDEKPDRHLRKL